LGVLLRQGRLAVFWWTFRSCAWVKRGTSEFDIPDGDEEPVEYASGDKFFDCGCPDQYYCAASRETECPRHSGFSRCCDRPAEHIPLKNQHDLRAAVSALWTDHLGAAFPARLRGEEIAGVDVVMLDADIAGYVTSWEGRGRVSDGQRQHRLRQLLRDMDLVLDGLVDSPEVEYFARLRALAKLMYAAGR
jgi:hypothetical protein